MSKIDYEPTDIDRDIVAKMLNYCNYTDRSDWVSFGAAIHSEFGKDGFDLFDDWSQTQSEYNKAAVKATYKSYKKKGITIGFLIGRALEGGFKFDKKEISPEDRKRLKVERELKVKERAKQDQIDEEKVEVWRLRLSDFLMSIMDKFDAEGSSPYLENKHVAAFGLLFAHQQLIIICDQEKDLLQLICGHDRCKEFFNIPTDEKPKFRQFKKGIFAIPLYDIDGRIWNLQIIYGSGKKSFLPGRKAGCFHVIGNIPQHGRFNLCQAEGYANAACVHMALGHPVVVAFDDGNMPKVAKAFHESFGDRINKYAFFADNDLHLTKRDPPKKNAGLVRAQEAAKLVNGFVVVPDFGEQEMETDQELDHFYDDVKAFVIETQKAGASVIQRKFKVGYNRASRILIQLEKNEIISAATKENSRRKVLIAASETESNG